MRTHIRTDKDIHNLLHPPLLALVSTLLPRFFQGPQKLLLQLLCLANTKSTDPHLHITVACAGLEAVVVGGELLPEEFCLDFGEVFGRVLLHEGCHLLAAESIGMTSLLSVVPDTNGVNKYVATFEKEGRKKRTHFGAKGMDDYTLTHDKEQRARYRERHGKDLETGDPTRAGYLSYYILWGPSTSIRSNVAAYKRKFGL